MANRDVICIGGSAGATGPLRTILRDLPSDLQASVFVVLHIPSRSLGILTSAASAVSQLPVRAAVDGMSIEPGTVYIAVPDRHLIIAHGQLRLGRGPRENMARPAIDPLFRSAAAAFGPRVIGVVLSGLLNDGASGLEAIKRCGGLAIVQDPDDAVAAEMPRSALKATEVDYAIESVRIGDVLSDLVTQPAGPGGPVPPDIQLEVDIAAGERIDSQGVATIADPATLTCPQCGGVLSSVREGNVLRFRCQTGHGFTGESLAKQQEAAVDEALRVALRIVGERAELVARLAEDARARGRPSVADLYAEREVEYRKQAETIRRAVLLTMAAETPPDVAAERPTEPLENEDGP